MTKLRNTNTHPPIYYVHHENDLTAVGPEGSYGLAAGYLSVRILEPAERNLWEVVFQKLWKHACFSLAEGLKEIGVDAFAGVPCSRADLVEIMRWALLAKDIRELPRFIRKESLTTSFAGRDQLYIARNVFVSMESEHRREVQTLAICDDFAETGKTLFGLHQTLLSRSALATKRIALAAAGVSTRLGDALLSDPTEGCISCASLEEP